MSVTCLQILKALEARFSAPEWATFREMRNGTGSSFGRSLDLFAFNTYPSMGYRSLAIEIKVSRGDFIRELEKPEKRKFAESISQECYFAAPSGLIAPREIPEPWGLISVADTGVARITHRAKSRRVAPYDMEFVASIIRRASISEVELNKAAIFIEEMGVTAREVETRITTLAQAKADELAESKRDRIRREELDKLMGEGIEELRRLVYKETGVYGTSKLAADAVELVNRAMAGQLRTLGISSVRKTLNETIRTLQSAVNELPTEPKDG